MENICFLQFGLNLGFQSPSRRLAGVLLTVNILWLTLKIQALLKVLPYTSIICINIWIGYIFFASLNQTTLCFSYPHLGLLLTLDRSRETPNLFDGHWQCWGASMNVQGDVDFLDDFVFQLFLSYHYNGPFITSVFDLKGQNWS